MKKLLFPIIIVVVTVLSGCTKDDSVVTSSAKNYLTLWNPCEAVTVLQEYVEDVTNPSSKNFIKKEDRIVTFDMDGTFVGELYPTYFEYNMLEERSFTSMPITRFGSMPIDSTSALQIKRSEPETT